MLEVPPFLSYSSNPGSSLSPPSSNHPPPRHTSYRKTRYPHRPKLDTTGGTVLHHQEGTFTLTIQPADGDRWLRNEEEDSDSAFTVSESGFSEFRTIKTVTDLGLRKYAPEQFPTLAPICSRGGEDARATEEAFDASLDADHQEEYSLKSVSGQLWKAMAMAKYSDEKEKFLPHDKLFSIVNDLAIQCILAETFNTEQQRRDNKERLIQICGDEHETSRRMVFTILVIQEKVNYIDDFISNEIYDINLPFSQDESAGNNSFRVRKVKGRTSGTKFCFPDWEDRFLDRFCEDQYRVVTPYLHVSNNEDKEVHFYKFHRKIRLPFTDWEWKKQGGYGAISRVKIHKAHHAFVPGVVNSETDPVFAVKSLHTTDDERDTREVEVLQRFSGSRRGHPHLIRLLMAFKHAKKMHLLFPWASGNLFELWAANPEPEQSNEMVQWLINQCSGLAGGLAKVHHHDTWPRDQNGKEDQLGRHGDIKPLNILWFASIDELTQKQKNHLVLADFGLTIFHSASGNTELTTANRLRGCSRTYRPPEVDLGDGKILQSYDIWSLACLYLEFITWYLRGFKMTYNETPGLNPVTFADHRIAGDNTDEDKFFTIRKESDKVDAHEAVVKPEVKQWISDLRNRDNCPQCLVDFLDFIQNRMLLSVAFERADMKEVNNQLVAIRNECKLDSYCGGRGQSILGRSARKATDIPATGTLRDPANAEGGPDVEGSVDLFDLSGSDDNGLDIAIIEQLQRTETIPAEECWDGVEEGDDAPNDDTEHRCTTREIIPVSGECVSDQNPRRSRKDHEMPQLVTDLTASTFDESQIFTPPGSAAMAMTPYTTQPSAEESIATDQDDDHESPTLSNCNSSMAAESLLSLSDSPGVRHPPVPGADPGPSQANPTEPSAARVNFQGEAHAATPGSERARRKEARSKGIRARYHGKAKRILKQVWDKFKVRVESYFSDDETLMRRSTLSICQR
ncbi:kinase-like protein [Apiospora saccharicola]|uniref:Kinase-like protein n=1 Tax=Apiospora saccharicola TaxID=335842 RepID=A0ABR1W480_9PEZI